VSTHWGLYQYNRLPFGVASAPAVFQKLMEETLQGIQGVACYLDDLFITGKMPADHWCKVEEVLKRLNKWGKCSFLQPAV